MYTFKRNPEDENYYGYFTMSDILNLNSVPLLYKNDIIIIDDVIS